jgi:hypothetical protein
MERDVQAERFTGVVMGGTLAVLADLARGGVAVQSLPAGTALTVTTRNTEYRVLVIDGEQLTISIRGGRLFHEWTVARLLGSTAGGSALKIGWLTVGLQMELKVCGRVYLTSPVESIVIDDSAGDRASAAA